MRRILRGTLGVLLLAVLTYGAVPLFPAPSTQPTDSLLIDCQPPLCGGTPDFCCLRGFTLCCGP